MTVGCAQTDPGITAAVKSKLAADTQVKAYEINVDTHDGVVTLTGNVDSSAAKEQAIIVARGTDGVHDVIDHLNVTMVPPSESTSGEIRDDLDKAGDRVKEAGEHGVDATKDAAAKTGEVISDAAITTAVKSKLLADSKTPGMKIDVDTKDGIVTLSGNVRTSAEADHAVSVARDTKGVKRVVSKLMVNG
jgi:hyperosmotically inducible protein